MAFKYVPSPGVANRLEFPAITTGNSVWRFHVTFSATNLDGTSYFILSSIGGTTSRLIFTGGPSTHLIRLRSGINHDFTIAAADFDFTADPGVKVEFESNGTDLLLYINDALYATKAGGAHTISLPFDLAGEGAASATKNNEIYALYFNSGFSQERNYDIANTSTGLTVVDLMSSQNATHVGAPADGSQWVSYVAAADTTAPTFNAAPAVTATSETGHTIASTLNEAGTLYGVRLASGATAPSSAQVVAGQNNAGSAAPEAVSVAATAATSADLTFSTGAASTAYDYYIVAQDDEGTPNLQAAPTLASATTAAAAGPTFQTVPATAFPSQSIALVVTNAGATQGTGGVTIGGVAQTVTAWSDTSITITCVLGANSYGAGKTVTLTTNGADTATGAIELVANTVGAFGYVVMASPNTTDDSSVAFNTTPTVANPDQFEWEDFNALGSLAIDASGFVSSVSAQGTFRGRFWDATDSTWGAPANFTAEVTTTVVPQGTWTIGTITKGQTTASFTPTYSGTDATSYQYSIGGGAYTAFTGTISLSGLSAEVAYSGLVRAVNAVGNGAAQAFSFTTDAVPVTPQVPQGAWTQGAVNAGQNAATFTPTYSLTDATSYEFSTNGVNWVVFTGEISLSGLEAGTSYNVELRAVNATGAGAAFAFTIVTDAIPTLLPVVRGIGRKVGLRSSIAVSLKSSINSSIH
jgi:hypothetical protein